MLSANGSPEGGNEMASDMGLGWRRVDADRKMDARANYRPASGVGLTGGENMLKLTRVLIAGALASILLFTATAEAAAPGGGTLSKAKRSVTWNGGPFTT